MRAASAAESKRQMRTVIDKYAGLRFRYGQDCCQFVGECIQAITGKNPIGALIYSDEREAYAIINRFGDLEGAMRHFLGKPYDGHKDGDACLMDNNGGRLAAAIIWRNEVIGRVENGLMNYPLDRAKLVWCT